MNWFIFTLTYMPHSAAIIIPTYNERTNIMMLLSELAQLRKKMYDTHVSVIIVDDESPDGTGQVVANYQKNHKWVYLLSGKKSGLGMAYKRGINYALQELDVDVVVQMDADLSHDPQYLPQLISTACESPDRYVIGSRYIPGGGVASDWPRKRRLVSWFGNVVARYLTGLYPVHDCTSGYKAIHVSLLQQIDWSQLHTRGYYFQVHLLHAATRVGAEVVEFPIIFYDRTNGESKMRLYDVIEFGAMSILLGLQTIKYVVFNWIQKILGFIIFTFFLVALVMLVMLVVLDVIAPVLFGWILFTCITLFIIFQSIFTLFGMMYAWERPRRVEKNRSPQTFFAPQHSFSVIIPALHEAGVIGDTIRAAASIDYPDSMKELLVVCREDDEETIRAAKQAIQSLQKSNIFLLIPPFTPKNKPDKLNYALRFTSKEVVCVFDAEDSPHRDIFHVINTVLVRDQVDVVQAGVQLINFRSTWFSTLNVLEYFFWFKSVLHFFADKEFIPLGGNTVFIKREWLEKVQGWDSDCLTEDADLGIKLSTAGARIRIIYDEVHATQEETPATLKSFIRQRTRWNQGFLQVFKKGDWKQLPRFSQRFLIGYILLWPEIQAGFFLFIGFSIFMMVAVKLPVVLALLSVLPLYILLLSVVVLNVGLYEFAKKYHGHYPKLMILKVCITFLPYQLVLGYSALRAVLREMRHDGSWEKTEHVNAHRPAEQIELAGS